MKNRIIILSVALLVIVSAGTWIFLNNIYVVPVLMYHSIDYHDKDSKLSVRPEDFARQMEFLYRKRYNVVGLDKIVKYAQKKEQIPPKTLAITFDDGYYNNYKSAYHVLKQYNIPATLFIIIDRIGKPGYLGWKEIKEMSDSRIITIGSHTMSHPFLTSLGPKELRRELAESKMILEKGLGRRVDFLCYPMGRFNPEIESMAREVGYKCAVTTDPGPNTPNDDIYAIKRVRVSRTANKLIVFWLKSSGYYNFIRESSHK